MKKKIALLIVTLIILLTLTLPTVAMADSATAVQAVDWRDLVIDNALEVVTTLFVTLIGVFGVWLTSAVGKNEKFKTVNAAQKELIRMAQITVGELKQTVSEKMKAASKTGKLTSAQIAELKTALLEKTKEKMSEAALNVLVAAAVDVNKLIIGAGEAWIGKLNAPQGDTYNISN